MSGRRSIPLLLVVGTWIAACGPVILSDYQSSTGVGGGTRRGPHAGIDLGDAYGAPVLAAADGEVRYLSSGVSSCGIGVTLLHQPSYIFTVYCHLSQRAVTVGQKVKRGEVIGFIGTTGNSAGIAHVHFELNRDGWMGHPDGYLFGTLDPNTVIIGCFDPSREYHNDHLVLTYPVRCKN